MRLRKFLWTLDQNYQYPVVVPALLGHDQGQNCPKCHRKFDSQERIVSQSVYLLGGKKKNIYLVKRVNRVVLELSTPAQNLLLPTNIFRWFLVKFDISCYVAFRCLPFCCRVHCNILREGRKKRQQKKAKWKETLTCQKWS